MFFKLINVHLLVSELYINQNVRCNDKKKPYVPLAMTSRHITVTQLFQKQSSQNASYSHYEKIAVFTRTIRMLQPVRPSSREAVTRSTKEGTIFVTASPDNGLISWNV